MTYELYIASERSSPERFCTGSRLCLHLMENLPHGYITLTNCDEMRRAGRPFPSWLTGTPTLVPDDTNEIYRGQDAVVHLMNLALSYRDHLARESAQGHAIASRGGHTDKSSSARTATATITGIERELPQDALSGSGHDVDPSEKDIADLWSSTMDAVTADGDEYQENRKLTSDDLARAVQQRQQQTPPAPSSHAPPPPPPQEKD